MNIYYTSVKTLANKPSLQRGQQYYKKQAILEVRTSYLPEIILLSVEGSYNDYEVSLPLLHLLELNTKDNPSALLIHSTCTCPHFFEGHICKHIVAGCKWLDNWAQELIPQASPPGKILYQKENNGSTVVEAKYRHIDPATKDLESIQKFLQGKGDFFTDLLIYNQVMPFLYELENLKPKKILTLLQDYKHTSKLIETNSYLKTFSVEWIKQLEQKPLPFTKAFENNPQVYGSRALLFLYFAAYPQLNEKAKVSFLATIYEALNVFYLENKPLGQTQDDSLIEHFISSTLVTQKCQDKLFEHVTKKNINPPSLHQKNLACLYTKSAWILQHIDSFSNLEIKELLQLKNLDLPIQKIDSIFALRLTDRVNFLKTNRREYQNISTELKIWQETVVDSESFSEFLKYAKTSHPKKKKFQEMLNTFK